MCKTVQADSFKRVLARTLLFTVLLAHACIITAQNKSTGPDYKAFQVLAERGEIVIRFVRPGERQMESLTRFMSIDRVNHDTVYAYLNREQFIGFLEQKIPYEIIPAAGLKQARTRAITTTSWRTQYPSYTGYLALMDSFAGNYPDLCRLTEVANTPGGHKVLVMKISAPSNDAKPAVLLTSTIHGDEPLGFVLLLRLIETLLSQYANNAEMKNMLDSAEIWINPLANPDGTYFTSDSTIYGATRFNKNHVDLNRNFPDPVKGDHPDSYTWQTETVGMMDFMKKVHIVLAANFHGGSEVVNYPWDSFSQLHPDDAWYMKISRQWADTSQAHSYPGYMTAQENGITNGYQWYTVYGGRQDYVNYFIHGREVTIELSTDKIPDESTLDDYWNYNYRSLLQYIQQVYTGISGIITDSLTGLPVSAMVSIPGHDQDNSQVYSDSARGYYCRLALEGTYTLEISASGYASKQITVKTEPGRLTHANVKLSPETQFLIYPNPFSDVIRINIDEPGKILEMTFTDLTGRVAKNISKSIVAAGLQEIRVDGLASGMYIVEFTYGDFKTSERILKVQ